VIHGAGGARRIATATRRRRAVDVKLDLPAQSHLSTGLSLGRSAARFQRIAPLALDLCHRGRIGEMDHDLRTDWPRS
jgi:hypothetical protein